MFPNQSAHSRKPLQSISHYWGEIIWPKLTSHPNTWIITILGEFFLIKVLMVRFNQGPEGERKVIDWICPIKSFSRTHNKTASQNTLSIKNNTRIWIWRIVFQFYLFLAEYQVFNLYWECRSRLVSSFSFLIKHVNIWQPSSNVIFPDQSILQVLLNVRHFDHFSLFKGTKRQCMNLLTSYLQINFLH